MFAERPLGQRALHAVGDAMWAAERATIWAGSATADFADRQPVPFAWYLMMPIVTMLVVIRTGASVAETYLDVQIPDNRALVSWLETQRNNLEQLQTSTMGNIRTQCVNEGVPLQRLMNTWPFNIVNSAAQLLGIVPMRADQQPSEAESTRMPHQEPVESSSQSDTLTQIKTEEHAAPSSREAEEPRTIAAEEAERAARTIVQPQTSAPPEHLLSAEASDRAVMDVVPPPQPAVPSVSSEELLAAEGDSGSEPGVSRRKRRKASSKATKASLLLNLFGPKIF
ncbi:uncharacterized protein LOC126088115 [Schistocerca cancellata]|uniref:uncharacterized protein LOC126088115 n=1 Tax=Schistocerca cancellata TaxID=274614 RepID=UPI0021196AC5|nr:uncharacterized protein LOC126088115 [Schistocerca cancellata]